MAYRRKLVGRFLLDLDNAGQEIQLFFISVLLFIEQGWKVFAVLSPKKM